MNVAVLGASRDPSRLSHRAVRAWASQGHAVFPVNPNADTIAGIRAWPDLGSVPEPLDAVLVYLPPALTRRQLEAIAGTGAREVYFNPGSADAETLEAARRLGIPVIEACAIRAIGEDPADWIA